MHTENTILMKAPLDRIFAAAADLSQWPKMLPHYRSITYFEKSEERNIVRMSARRGWIPVSWTSVQEIDYPHHEIRFRHLKAFTKGMIVVWSFTQTAEGVVVRIKHDLKPRIPLIGRFVAEVVIGRYFIAHIATQTLTHMKRFVEMQRGT